MTSIKYTYETQPLKAAEVDLSGVTWKITAEEHSINFGPRLDRWAMTKDGLGTLIEMLTTFHKSMES